MAERLGAVVRPSNHSRRVIEIVKRAINVAELIDDRVAQANPTSLNHRRRGSTQRILRANEITASSGATHTRLAAQIVSKLYTLHRGATKISSRGK